jgi:hypothetical protein
MMFYNALFFNIYIYIQIGFHKGGVLDKKLCEKINKLSLPQNFAHTLT